jgi:hypothetical protein
VTILLAVPAPALLIAETRNWYDGEALGERATVPSTVEIGADVEDDPVFAMEVFHPPPSFTSIL